MIINPIPSLEDIGLEKFVTVSLKLLKSDRTKFSNYFNGVVLPERAAQKFLQKIFYTIHNDDLQYYETMLSSISNIDISNFDYKSSVDINFDFLSYFQLSSFAVKSENLNVEKCLHLINQKNKDKLKMLRLNNVDFGPICDSLTRFNNIRFLNLSNSKLKCSHLIKICCDLENLVGLNISMTKVMDISPILRYEDQLELLDMHDLDVSAYNNIFGQLKSMRKLRYLDISSKDVIPTNIGSEEDILSCAFLKTICLLDLSGYQYKMKTDIWLQIIQKMVNLRYFIYNLQDDENLVPNNTKWDSFIANNNQIIFVGPFSLSTLLNSLKYCIKNRRYLNSTLAILFTKTRDFSYFNLEMVVTLLEHLQTIQPGESLLIAITAVFYNFTRNLMAAKWPLNFLTKMIHKLLYFLEVVDISQNVVLNTFLILSNDFIVQKIQFDKFKLGRLIFTKLMVIDVDVIIQTGVTILSVLVSELSRQQLSLLVSDPSHFRVLLKLICVRCIRKCDVPQGNDRFLSELQPYLLDDLSLQHDNTLKHTLSALWNLTDECPEACRNFVEQDGLVIYLTMIQNFKLIQSSNLFQVQNKCLGLLNNIAEDVHCRKFIVNSEYLSFLKEMLFHEEIKIIYFAGGILSNLLLIDDETWYSRTSESKSDTEKDVYCAVENWVFPNFMMASYRSFNPFESLIVNAGNSRAMVMWSLWAIRHALSQEREKYVKILENHPNLIQHIKKLTQSNDPAYNRIRGLANDIEKLYTTTEPIIGSEL